jgi:hypothetical protein
MQRDWAHDRITSCRAATMLLLGACSRPNTGTSTMPDDSRTALPDVATTSRTGAETSAVCNGAAPKPYGCNFAAEACVDGTCQSCGAGTRALVTECAKTCKADRDCPGHQQCTFVAGDVFVCREPAAPRGKRCPNGQVLLKSDGQCWTACKSNADCETGMCCRNDPNAPVPICMAACF